VALCLLNLFVKLSEFFLFNTLVSLLVHLINVAKGLLHLFLLNSLLFKLKFSLKLFHLPLLLEYSPLVDSEMALGSDGSLHVKLIGVTLDGIKSPDNASNVVKEALSSSVCHQFMVD
jgi:hypothetical protein